MNTSQIISLLRNSGFRVLGADGDFLLLEDPSCFLRSLSDFMDIAWMVLAFVTGVMLFGWAIAMIRGAKGDWMVNLRNLMLIFGILTATKPMINLVYGDDLFVQACNIIMVPISEVQKTLAARDLTLGPIAEESGMDLRGAGAPITIEDIRVIPGARSVTTQRVNNHRVISSLDVLSDADIGQMRTVIARHGIRIGNTRRASAVVGANRDGGRRGHEGTDLAARPGDNVVAFFEGRVTAINPMHHGLMSMTIRNDNGTTSFIGYVRANNLHVRDRVRAGSIIGVAQDISRAPQYRSTPNHVHYELWRGDKGSGDIIDIQDNL